MGSDSVDAFDLPHIREAIIAWLPLEEKLRIMRVNKLVYSSALWSIQYQTHRFRASELTLAGLTKQQIAKVFAMLHSLKSIDTSEFNWCQENEWEVINSKMPSIETIYYAGSVSQFLETWLPDDVHPKRIYYTAPFAWKRVVFKELANVYFARSTFLRQIERIFQQLEQLLKIQNKLVDIHFERHEFGYFGRQEFTQFILGKVRSEDPRKFRRLLHAIRSIQMDGDIDTDLAEVLRCLPRLKTLKLRQSGSFDSQNLNSVINSFPNLK